MTTRSPASSMYMMGTVRRRPVLPPLVVRSSTLPPPMELPNRPPVARKSATCVATKALSSGFIRPPLFQQPTEEHALGRLARDHRDRIHERDLLGADLYAVLRLATIGNAPVAHHRVEPLVFVHGPGRV